MALPPPAGRQRASRHSASARSSRAPCGRAGQKWQACRPASSLPAGGCQLTPVGSSPGAGRSRAPWPPDSAVLGIIRRVHPRWVMLGRPGGRRLIPRWGCSRSAHKWMTVIPRRAGSDAMGTQARPNIVFVLCDNVGWGDFSCYGRSTPTPRIDKLAGEGIRFNNYTVESQCTPTRSAILTGRQSVRSGTYTVPLPGQGPSGLAPWEYTIANLLSDAGYVTSLWGKWHLGDVEGRLPNDQGFDEWWGYKNSADECGYTSYATYRAVAKVKGLQPPQIWEGTKGHKSTPVRELNMEVRPLLDELIVGKATDFIKRQAKAGKPFFTYVGLSHVHPPEQAHPDFDQTDPARMGLYADLMAEMDYRVGQVVDCVDEAGIADNTIIVFSSDNATCHVPAFG